MSRADTALNHATARLLYRLGDAIQAGQVQRWQITAAAPLLTTLAKLLRPIPVQQQRQAEKASVPHD